MSKVGIFAGTFNPIHDGHLAFAQAALDAGLEKVWFLVEPRPRRKQGVRALEHRQAMVGLAIETNPKFGQIILEQARFTPHETLPILQARFNGRDLVLLFGDDVLSHIADWPHVEKLIDSVELMIGLRKTESQKMLHSMKYLEKSRGFSFRYTCLYPDKPLVSSSRLRLALKKRQSVTTVPPAVLDYIRKKRLYSSRTVSSED